MQNETDKVAVAAGGGKSYEGDVCNLHLCTSLQRKKEEYSSNIRGVKYGGIQAIPCLPAEKLSERQSKGRRKIK